MTATLLGVPPRRRAEPSKGGSDRSVLSAFARNIIHSWVEVLHEGKWINLEGFILDKPYLTKLQRKFDARNEPFCGFGVAISDFKSPPIEWRETDTYIQKDGINRDLGIFESPDEFYSLMA